MRPQIACETINRYAVIFLAGTHNLTHTDSRFIHPKSSAKQIPAILVARLISSNTLVLKKSIANFIRKNAKRRNNILTSPANPKLLFNIPHSVRFLISFWGDNLQYFKFCDIY